MTSDSAFMPATSSLPGPAALRVLVVEDDPHAAQSLVQLLKLYGYEAQVARDGPAALEAVKTGGPDVVFLDIGLPGLDGWEVARQVCAAAAPRRPLLVAVTAHGAEVDRQRSEEAGMDLHLVKPADPEQLLAILRRFQSLLSSLEPQAR